MPGRKNVRLQLGKCSTMLNSITLITYNKFFSVLLFKLQVNYKQQMSTETCFFIEIIFQACTPMHTIISYIRTDFINIFLKRKKKSECVQIRLTFAIYQLFSGRDI